jgi:predicted N-formylglutamate amidohydrolase
MGESVLFLTCEHGGNQIPADLQPLFEGAGEVLDTHRGLDHGALTLYQLFEKDLKPAFAISSETCRLVVDLNRSLHRRTLFSEWTKPLSRDQKRQILDEHYFPYRQAFIDALKKNIDQNKHVLHLSVHSFTPVLNGVVRQTDIGILYHPGRPWEKAIAALWKASLAKYLPQMRVRFNYPYLGKPDGHVAYHRKMYPDPLYAGIELELNSKYAFDNTVYEGVVRAFGEVLKLGGLAEQK